MKLTYKIGTGVATAAILASAFAPAILADSTIDISGNGANSKNKVILNSSCTIAVTQANNTTVGVNATVSSNTGGNKANSNTGGDVTIDTGDATSTVSVGVVGSTNDISALPDCACICQTGLDITIVDNGANSKNKVKKTTTILEPIVQGNNTTVGVNATVKAKTGKNKAKKNTNGTTGITTGNSSSGVGVSVTAPSNSL